MKIGYIRVSTAEQNIARQEVLMQELGVEQVFIDQMSGKSVNRPELQQLFHVPLVHRNLMIWRRWIFGGKMRVGWRGAILFRGAQYLRRMMMEHGCSAIEMTQDEVIKVMLDGNTALQSAS